MLKLMDLLTEGVYDKGILKAVFMAGGPGTGKSYVAKGLFGIPDKINISDNLKMFITIGFLGGFTTFSSFNVDIFELIQILLCFECEILREL